MKDPLNIGKSAGTGTPNIGTPSQNTIGNKVFDLHFEVGVNPNPMGGFYALTILGQGGVKFESQGTTPADALSKIVVDMEQSNMWQLIVGNPGINQFPFPANPRNGKPPAAVPVSSTNSAYDPKAPKQRPSDLTQVTHPDCQTMCQSYEHFKAAKCKSICGFRDGL